MKKLTICYFGIYNPEFSRNKIFMRGLRLNGVDIIECRDTSRGVRKLWRLWKMHSQIKNDYDVMIVGYPGHVMTWFAKLISPKKVVLDALCSMYEGEIMSRGVSPRSLFGLKTWLVDFFAYFFADLVLVQTNAQIPFLSKKFLARKEKFVRVFTGADDSVFFEDTTVAKKENFTAIFRGQFLPEAGIDIVLDSAKILEDKDVDFLIIGGGFLKKQFDAQLKKLNLKNVSVVDGFLPFDEMRTQMLSGHVSLGQFGRNERLDITMPHKLFETFALGIPYINADVPGVHELLIDGENCLLTKVTDAQDLADKIMELKNNPALAEKIRLAGLEVYKKELSPVVLGKVIIEAVSPLLV